MIKPFLVLSLLVSFSLGQKTHTGDVLGITGNERKKLHLSTVFMLRVPI